MSEVQENMSHHRDSRYFWIDTICINQEHDEERSQQVKLMDLIYKQAADTFIWLGKKDQYSTGFEQILADVKEAFRIAMASHVPETELILDKSEDLPISEKHALWAVPFRSWILQEVLHSKDTLVMIGSVCFSFAFLGACEIFKSAGLSTTQTQLSSWVEFEDDSPFRELVR